MVTQGQILVDDKIADVRPARRSWRHMRLWRYPDLVVGGVFFAVVVLVVVLAPLLSPYNPATQNPSDQFAPMSLQHLMGTDDFGRDIFSRILYGGRPILTIGVTSIVLAMVVGLIVGVLGGYYRGWIDHALMALMDLLFSFPFVLLAILVVTALGPGIVNAIIAISVASIAIFARLARSIVISLRGMPYVEAAIAAGMGSGRILWRHILPNLLGPLIVMATANLAMAIGYASALNFLGLGVQPPTPDWGVMVSDGKQFIYSALQVPFFPGLAITLTVVSLNFLGDGLQALLDPAGRRGTG